MAKGEKTKSLWENPLYREHMSRVHKPLKKSIEALVIYLKSKEGRENISNRMKGRVPWNKGLKTAIVSQERKDDYRMRRMFRARLQKQVFERDNYNCQICGEHGRRLQVDHIQPWADYVELRFNIDNCRTLCQPCHYKITYGKPMPPSVRAWGHNFMGGSKK